MSSYQEFMNRAEKFFESSKDESGLSILNDVRRMHEQDRFRVCLVGGFSKGKTHLLNGLLQTELFPETISPTTTLLTEVGYSTNSGFTFCDAQGKHDYDLTHENLEQFCAEGIHADAEGVLAVRFSAEFIQHGILLYDTPGVDDVLEERANVTFRALETCDAAMVAISAISPISLGERAFIDSYLQGRAIPKIAIVLTFLDKVPAEELEKQIHFIASKARKLYPNTEIWCAQEVSVLTDDICEAVGLDAIRKRIQEWSMMPDLQALRQKRDYLRLKSAVDATVTRQKAFLANIQGDAAERRNALAEAYNSLDKETDAWLGIRKGFMDKSTIAAEEVRKGIQKISKELTADIAKEKSGIFENALRVTLQQRYAELASDVQERLQQDMQSLAYAIKDRFGIEPVFPISPVQDIQVSDDILMHVVEPHSNELSNILQVMLDSASRFLDRITMQLPMNSMPRMVLETVVHNVIDYGKNLLGEGSEQKKLQMQQSVSSFCTQFEKAIERDINAMYGSIADFIRDQQREWIETQSHALNEAHEIGSLEQTISGIAEKILTGTQLSADLKNA